MSCNDFRTKLLSCSSSLDLDHPHVREIVQHFARLESDGRVDSGTCVEMQNRLNQIARMTKWPSPRMRLISSEILRSRGKGHECSTMIAFMLIRIGKAYLCDREGFQMIQTYRSMLDDLEHVFEFEFYVRKLASEHRLSDDAHDCLREFVYRVSQGDLPIDTLARCCSQFRDFQHVKQMDIDQVEGLIETVSRTFSPSLPQTLTERLLMRLKWDAVEVNSSAREQLLQVGEGSASSCISRGLQSSQCSFAISWNMLVHCATKHSTQSTLICTVEPISLISFRKMRVTVSISEVSEHVTGKSNYGFLFKTKSRTNETIPAKTSSADHLSTVPCE